MDERRERERCLYRRAKGRKRRTFKRRRPSNLKECRIKNMLEREAKWAQGLKDDVPRIKHEL